MEACRHHKMRIRLSRAISNFLLNNSFKGSGRLMRITSKLLMPAPLGPSVIPTNLGFSMLVDPSLDKGLETSLYYYGIYEAGTLHVIENSLRLGDTFIDIGANIGLMTLTASQMVGKSGCVHSFEPVPETYAILEQNISINRVSNVICYDKALGATKETKTIYRRNDISRGSASLIKPNKHSGKYDVEVDTLDNFIESRHIDSVHMLKIDVEGWELRVLRGGKRLFRSQEAPILCLEYSTLYPTQGDLVELYEFIISINNYTVYKLERGKERISRLIKVLNANQLPQHDNLFCFRPEHLRTVPQSIFRHLQCDKEDLELIISALEYELTVIK